MATINIVKGNTFSYIKQVFMQMGNTIYIERGIYSIPETLYINSNNIIYGNGSTFRMGGHIANILMSYTTPNTTKYNGVQNVEIHDLNVEQMYSKYGACKCNGITFWHAKNIILTNVKAYDTIYFHGIELNGCCNVTMNECELGGYVKDAKNDFREGLQIDFSSESAIFLHKSGSKCYDNTPCKNITLTKCIFKRHGKRIAPTIGAGNHCQGVNIFHENIKFDRCEFYGDQNNKAGYAIRLIGMKNVTIENCICKNFSRFVYIMNATYSYNKRGKKQPANNMDGCCDNVIVRNNHIWPLKTFKVVDVFAKSVTKGEHTRIINQNNQIME